MLARESFSQLGNSRKSSTHDIEEPRGGPLSAANDREEMAGESGREPRIDRRELKRGGAWWIENRCYLDAIRIAYTEARQILDNSFRSIFNAINLRFPLDPSPRFSKEFEMPPVIKRSFNDKKEFWTKPSANKHRTDLAIKWRLTNCKFVRASQFVRKSYSY